MNHKEVVKEYKKNQMPKNWEKKQEWVEWKLEDERKKEEAASKGENYERIKLLDVQADEAERLERRKNAKKNPDPGFSSFETATIRQYNKLVKNIKPDMNKYQELKEELGESCFYAGKETMIHGMFKDTKEGIDRMVDDLNKQLEKRAKFSRRRAFDDSADIDYINERNMRFNKKLERFYAPYTAEIKQNLERGTAV